MQILSKLLYALAYLLNYIAGFVHAHTERVTGRYADFGYILGMRRADKISVTLENLVKFR